MDARGTGKVSWLPRKRLAQTTGLGEEVTGEDYEALTEEPGQDHIGDPKEYGRALAKLVMINETLNQPNNLQLATQVPGAQEEFESLAEQLREDYVRTLSPQLIDDVSASPRVQPAWFRQEHIQRFYEDLLETKQDSEVAIAQEATIEASHNPNEFTDIARRFEDKHQEIMRTLVTQRLPVTQRAKRRIALSQNEVTQSPELSQGPLAVEKYTSLQQLSEDLCRMGPSHETYDKILLQVDDEDQDSAKSALTAFFQGLPQGLCTIYSILVKAGMAEAVDAGIVEKIMELHPKLNKDQKEASFKGLVLPPTDSGLYTTAECSAKQVKEASGFLGGPSQHYYMYGCQNNRYCPKLRNVVSTFVCRYHCVDGLPIDDHQILCGEAIWRQNVMDKFSREYKDEDGNWVGGYLNKRFEIERSTHEHPAQLKPGQRQGPINEDAWVTEKRLQEMRRAESSNRKYSETPGDPKGLYNWDAYESVGGPENPQLSEKDKDKIAKIASLQVMPEIRASMWDDDDLNIVTAKTYDKTVPEEKFKRCKEKVRENSPDLPEGAEYGICTKQLGGQPASYQKNEKDASKEGVPVNPWAVCTKTVGRDDEEKYERCVQDVKKKHPIRKDKVPEKDASGNWSVKKAGPASPALKQCKDCKQFCELGNQLCPACGSPNLVTKSEMEHSMTTKSIENPPIGAPREASVHVKLANGIFRATVNGYHAYGVTQKEAIDKANDLAKLRPPTLEEASEELANTEADIRSAPGSSLYRPRPSPQAISEEVIGDPTPTTKGKPMIEPPDVQEVIQGGESYFPEGEAKTTDLEARNIDEEARATSDATPPEERKTLDFYQKQRALGPD